MLTVPDPDDKPAAAAIPTERAHRSRQGGRERWRKHMVVGTVAVFVLAVLGITGLELVKGSALSGGSGTTVSHVGRDLRGTGAASPSSGQPSAPASSAPTDPPSPATPSTGQSTGPSTPARSPQPASSGSTGTGHRQSTASTSAPAAGSS